MKIRILHCVETIASGGVEQVRLTLIKGLDKEKYEHKIICTWEGGPIAQALKSEGVELLPIGSFKHPFQWSKHSKVLQTIKEFKPHIIHGAIFEGMSMATIGGLIGKVPVVILEETSDPQNRSAKANWLLRQFTRFSDMIIAISPDVKNYLLQFTKITNQKIRLINNGVSFPLYPTQSEILSKRNDLGLKEADIVVGFVGRLYNDHKRLTDLLEAVVLLEEPDIKLLVVGNGMDEGLILNKIKDLNMQDQVFLAGFQGNTSLYYSIMDIFCVPSSREGFGLVAVEAMFHKLPVVASKVGGLKNVVIDGETGYLTPPLSPEAIAKKLKVLIRNKALRLAFGIAGYNRAIENYSSDQYCRAIESLYTQKLMEKGLL